MVLYKLIFLVEYSPAKISVADDGGTEPQGCGSTLMAFAPCEHMMDDRLQRPPLPVPNFSLVAPDKDKVTVLILPLSRVC